MKTGKQAVKQAVFWLREWTGHKRRPAVWTPSPGGVDLREELRVMRMKMMRMEDEREPAASYKELPRLQEPGDPDGAAAFR